MPTFTPPTVPETRRDDPDSEQAKDLLFRNYAPQDSGQTIWKDPNGTWHIQLYPYQGGNIYRVFDDGTLVSETADDPVICLANATEVYLGGHIYTITEDQATELTNAGFGDGIT